MDFARTKARSAQDWDSKRYHLQRTERLILFPYERGEEGATSLIPEKDLRARFPLTWAYLADNRSFLENRENGKMRGARWYGFGRTQALDIMPLPKVFTPDIAMHPSYSLDPTGDLFFTGGVSGGYGILVSAGTDRAYMLGLLNSRILDWLIRQTATQMRGGYFSYEARYIRHLPIPVPGSAREARAQHDRIVALVARMLLLQSELRDAKLTQDRTAIQRQIDAVDRQIDGLAYELYDLSEAEIRLVEDATAD